VFVCGCVRQMSSRAEKQKRSMKTTYYINTSSSSPPHPLLPFVTTPPPTVVFFSLKILFYAHIWCTCCQHPQPTTRTEFCALEKLCVVRFFAGGTVGGRGGNGEFTTL
jgi:hypothetical protein